VSRLLRLGAWAAAPSRPAEALVVALGLAAAVPLWWVAHPPIQDLPQHLAAIRVIHDYGDPGLRFADHFTLALGRTQYLAYYLSAHLLAFPLGVELANRVLLTAVVAGTPWAVAALARGLGRSPVIGLAAVPLLWNAHLILGFLNFVAAIPLALAAVALAVSGRRDEGAPATGATERLPAPAWGSRRREVGLGALLLLTFTTHVVPFAFAVVGVACCAVDGGVRRTVRRGALLIPAALAVAVWTLASPAGRSTAAAATGGGARFVAVPTAFAELPGWLTDVLHGPTDDRLLVAWLVLTFTLLVFGLARLPRRRPDPPSEAEPVAGSDDRLRERLGLRLAVLPPLALILYFVAPASYDWIWPIHARFPLLAAFWLLPLLRLPSRPRALAPVLVVAAAAISIGSVVAVGRAFVRFEREEVGPLDAAVAAIPEGSRTAGLIFDRGSRYVKFSPFIHSVAWVQARRGGAVMFTFADFPPSPFRFREPDRPPRVPPRWEWTPERVDVVGDLGWYDHVLVRGPPRPLERARDVWTPVFRDGPWSVWRRRDDR